MQNAFDRLGNQGDLLGSIEENTRSSSESVAVGGDLYEKVNELTTAITDMKDGKVSGGMGIKNALALAIVSPAMEGIGKGFGFIVEAINNLEGSGEEIKAKTEALVGGLVLLGDVGKSILKFAGYIALATPLLLIAAIGTPLLALSLLIILFSLAGIPPLAGFFAKFYIFKSVLEQSMFFLAIVGLLSTVVAAFYYLRLIKIMYFDEEKEKFDTDHSMWLKFSLGVSTLLILAYFIFPSHLIEVVSKINII